MIIGGLCDGSRSSLIAKYTSDTWEQVGNLQNTRSGHRAISNGNRIYIVGGADSERFVKKKNFVNNFRNNFLSTEIWSIDDNDNTVNMKVAEPELNHYYYYPELFLVPFDFCSMN